MTLNPELLSLLYNLQENDEKVQTPELANIILQELDYYTGEYCVDTGNMINVEVAIKVGDALYVGKGATFEKSFGYRFKHDITFELVKPTAPVNRTIGYRMYDDGAGSCGIDFYNKVGLAEWMEEFEVENDIRDGFGEPTTDSFKCDNFEGTITTATECFFEVIEHDIEELITEFKEKFLPERPTIEKGFRDNWLILEGRETYMGISLEEAEAKLDLYYSKN